MAVLINDENFEKEINKAEKPVLVDFFATWCEPCTILAPILEKVADEFSERLVLMKVNLDEIPLTAQKYEIDRIPTVVIFKNGKPFSGFVGVKAERDVKSWLESILGENNASGSDEQEKITQLSEEFKNYAEKNGFRLNPDREKVKGIIKGLLENEKKYGKKYCPCRRVKGDETEDSKIICPCVYHRDEIEKDGSCLCGLYVK